MILGDAYLMARLYEKAVSEYKKMIHIQPNNLFAHLTLAASYTYMERKEDARAEAAEMGLSLSAK
jgi:Tfp pilus assembly protein PilF